MTKWLIGGDGAVEVIAERRKQRYNPHPLVDAALLEQMGVGVAKQQVVDPHTGRKKYVQPLELEGWLALAEWQRLRDEFPEDNLPLYPQSLYQFARRIQAMGPRDDLASGNTAYPYTEHELHFFVALCLLTGTQTVVVSRFMALSHRQGGGVALKTKEVANAMKK